MNQITTRQISEASGKRHSNVTRAFRTFCGKTNRNVDSFAKTYSKSGKDFTEYDIDASTAKEFLSWSAPELVEKFCFTQSTEVVVKEPAKLTLKDVESQPLPDNIEGMTMSSREIAELTGKRHDNVMADIRSMLEQLGEAAPEFSGTARIPGPNNSTRTVEVFNLPYRETMILVTGYSVPLRAKVVDRWQEMEKEVKAKNVGTEIALPRSFAEALRLAADQAEVLEKQKEALALAAPKVEFYDQVAESQNWMDLMSTAKALNLGRNSMTEFMRKVGLLQMEPHKNMPYQQYISSGHFKTVVKTTVKEDGTPITYNKTLVSGKGLTLIQKRISENPVIAGVVLKAWVGYNSKA